MKPAALGISGVLVFPIPLYIFQRILKRSVARIAKQHPRIFQRLGAHAAKTFLIDPVDMPFVIVLHPKAENPRIEVKRRYSPSGDAKISGTFRHLIALVEAENDGDALFFSRDLVIEGDTEAVVALRNALDDMDGNVVDEAARAFGRPGELGLKLARKIGRAHHVFAE